MNTCEFSQRFETISLTDLFQKHGIDLTVPQAQMNLDIDNKVLEEKHGKERFM